MSDDELMTCIYSYDDLVALESSDDSLAARAKALRAADWTYAAIAKELGLATNTAWKLCRDDRKLMCKTNAPRGERNRRARLTRRDVIDIRRSVADGARAIAPRSRFPAIV